MASVDFCWTYFGLVSKNIFNRSEFLRGTPWGEGMLCVCMQLGFEVIKK